VSEREDSINGYLQGTKNNGKIMTPATMLGELVLCGPSVQENNQVEFCPPLKIQMIATRCPSFHAGLSPLMVINGNQLNHLTFNLNLSCGISPTRRGMFDQVQWFA
jgi:hypothetical protein